MPLNKNVPLICPKCRQPLAERLGPPEGPLRCGGCAAEYPWIDGVLHFVEHDQYVDSFSYEWQQYAKTLLEPEQRKSSERTLLAMEVTPELVNGKLVLDAGCGMGRFTDVLLSWGAEVVAIDLSESIHTAKDNLKGREGVAFVQTDIFHLPFPPGTFDVILSWGVLHHTPDCAGAFRALSKHVRPGGSMGVYIYGKTKGARRRMITFYRNITTHLPRPLLHAFCQLAVPMYYVYKIPLLGNLFRFLVPMSRQKDARFRVLETFDEYAPRHASRHAFPEVFAWFRQAGFKEIRIFDPPVRAIGVMGEGGPVTLTDTHI